MKSLQEHSSDFVVMPWKDTSEITVTKGGMLTTCTRWELIQSQLSASTIVSNHQDLINLINSYNVKFENGKQIEPPWKFQTLHKYFTTLSNSEYKKFFEEEGTLSSIKKLALQLKDLIPQLKILKTGIESSVKLHQLQIASLLSNAFLCTFPKTNANCPSINFTMLFEAPLNSNSNVEKIKCIVHYFTRIREKQPTGSLSFHRLVIPDHKFPRWDKTNAELTSLKVEHKGKIEDQQGHLQMDFANRYVGGGVIGKGCVQEEIRFTICPELIATRLFTECLAANEALLIVGAERYCQYSGYASTFKFTGDNQDETPFDENGQRKVHLAIVDALHFHRFHEQFRESKILRELKKAYVGFRAVGEQTPIPLATGNWGCGVYGGDPQLKSLLQLMAASQARRNVLYLTFGDQVLKNQIQEMYQLLKEKSVNVGLLYRIIRSYNKERRKEQTLFQFITEALKDSEKYEKPHSKSNLSTSTFSSLSSLSSSTFSSTCKYSYPVQSASVVGEDAISSKVNFESSTLNENAEGTTSCQAMDIDFDPLDEELAKQVDDLTSGESAWLEKETGNRQSDGKRLEFNSSPSLFSDEEADGAIKVEEMAESEKEPLQIVATECSSLPSQSAYANEIRKGYEAVDKRLSSSGKKLVQKKITDCFLKN